MSRYITSLLFNNRFLEPPLSVNEAMELANIRTPLALTDELIVVNADDNDSSMFTKNTMGGLLLFFQERIFTALASLDSTTELATGDEVIIQGDTTAEGRTINTISLIRALLDTVEPIAVADDQEFIIETGTELRRISVGNVVEYARPRLFTWDSGTTYNTNDIVYNTWTYERDGTQMTKLLTFRSVVDNNVNNEPPSSNWRLAQDITIPVTAMLTTDLEYDGDVLIGSTILNYSDTRISGDSLGFNVFLSTFFTNTDLDNLGNFLFGNFQLPSTLISISSFQSLTLERSSTDVDTRFRIFWHVLVFTRNESNVRQRYDQFYGNNYYEVTSNQDFPPAPIASPMQPFELSPTIATLGDTIETLTMSSQFQRSVISGEPASVGTLVIRDARDFLGSDTTTNATRIPDRTLGFNVTFYAE